MEGLRGKEHAQNKDAVKRESKRLFIVVIAGVILFFALLAAVFLFRPASDGAGEEVYGNTSGNLANQGWVAESDGWIYFSNAVDDFSLHKVRADGSERTRLNDMITFNINVYDEWVYYLAPIDKEGSEELLAQYGMIEPALYKTRTDGSETVKISDKANKFVIYNSWIYYKNVGDGTIGKMRTDGTQITPVTDDPADDFAIAGGWIYYRNRNDGDALYKISIDGTGKTQLDGSNVISINVLDGWVYYADLDAEAAFLPIYKIRTDGTDKTEITDPGGFYINVAGGWIYYWCGDDKSLHKIRTDGSENTIISGKGGDMINIAGDWLYYLYISPDIEQYSSGCIELYRMKTDGTENQRVE